MEFIGSARVAALFLLIFFTHPVFSDDEEDHLLQGINSFRQSANIPVLTKNDRANCLADEIADDLEDRSCNSSSLLQRTEPLSNHQNALQKCNVDVNTTGGAVVLPVCVPDRVATLVLTNYTQSPNARYLNDSRFNGVGIGTEHDWTVVVLATSTTGGSLASSSLRRSAAVSPMLLLTLLWVLM